MRFFVQDNESKSSKRCFKRTAFSKPPFDQAKLVRCIQGKVLDVVVDLRKKSQTYGQYIYRIIQKIKTTFILAVLHGFLVLSETAVARSLIIFTSQIMIWYSLE